MALYALAKEACKEYMESPDYKEGHYKDPKYKTCCETFDFCSFYVQTWFWALVGGLIALAIIASIVGSCICCRRRGGGKDANFNYDDDSEPSDDSTSSTKPNPA
ncbi:hypothetical protein GCK72_007618 [Caenorhabditis remanei]|uniref:Uncharacterized protein n=1 Tax=Caenorhabditis remanei TaxID=31234 RepID=A0A6A5HJI8_CAERE|nr:hypothetical protein GCK72_007618 [Caenorhabditis remanei]KAF1767659.1 hypothetical protein GCK72_007618 [Caenorhabditis remanei]